MIWRCAIVAFLFLFNHLSLAMAAEIRETIPPEEVAVTEDDEGFAAFSGTAIQFLTLSGEPQIPSHVIRLMLPADADPASVSVSIENETLEELPEEWEVRPVPPAAFWDGSQVVSVFPEDKTIEDGRDVDIYETDAFFPQELVGNFNVGEMRGALMVEVPVTSHQWNPVTKKLVRLAEADLVVTFDGSEPASPGGDLGTADTSGTSAGAASTAGRRLDPMAQERARRTLRNYERIAQTYPVRPQRTALYVIITTRDILADSAELRRFVASKRGRFALQRPRIGVAVVTERTWGGGTGDTAAENIRAWLVENYIRRNIQYVLLVGNPHPESGDVPMKMLWPRRNATSNLSYRDSPSDFYYADLTGNWDLDGDGFFGEWGDDFGAGGVDRNWEVLVGRIPFYGDFSDLDSILAKITRYERESPRTAEWRENVLIAMEPLDPSTPGFRLGEAIKNDIIVPKGWDYHRIYNENYGLNPRPETVPTTVDNVTRVWRGEPFGAVFWSTHGSETLAVDIMNSDRAMELNNDFPSFTFQGSCCNASPENERNLAYAILLNGGIGTVGATRVSWYFPGQSYFANSAGNQGMTYEYARRLITEEMAAGNALYDLKENVVPFGDSLWMNYTDYSLYGDPSVGLFTSGGRDLRLVAD